MQIPHWPNVINEGCMKKVEYPLTPDTTIAVGDRVRSFDFINNAQCYFVGVVESLTPMYQYKIKVEYQVWEGERTPAEQNYCGYVAPPINGSSEMFDTLPRGVQRVREGEEA